LLLDFLEASLRFITLSGESGILVLHVKVVLVSLLGICRVLGHELLRGLRGRGQGSRRGRLSYRLGRCRRSGGRLRRCYWFGWRSDFSRFGLLIQLLAGSIHQSSELLVRSTFMRDG
jgi:hypothetical protein